MKLLLVLATAVAVFTTDGQTTDRIAGEGEAEGRQSFSGVAMVQVPAEQEFDIEVNRIDTANDGQQMREHNISTAGESEDQAFGNINKILDMEELLGRARRCRRMDGRCYRWNIPCKKGFQESPRGRPYCTSKRRRCCYPAESVCPDGFFNVPDSGNQCFKFFNDFGRSWNASYSKCLDEQLEMAKPINPVAVRKHLVEHFGNGTKAYAWMGARGNGDAVVWNRDGTVVGRNNPAWYKGSGGRNSPDIGECLMVLATAHHMSVDLTGPYNMNYCTGTNKFPLCELVLKKKTY